MSDTFDSVDPPLLGNPHRVGEQGEPRLDSVPVVAGRALIYDLTRVAIWVAITDFLLYRTGTFFAWAIFLMVAVVFFAIVKRLAGHGLSALFCALLLLVLSLKLIWCGGWLQVGCGIFLVFSYVMALTGVPPFLPELMAFFGHVFSGAAHRLGRFRLRQFEEVNGLAQPGFGVQVWLPFGTVVAFSLLFILANPNISGWFTTSIQSLSSALGQWMMKFDIPEGVFWIVSAWLILGLLYPTCCRVLKEKTPQELVATPRPARLFHALRNSLISVIVLFAFYMVFEFSTLWFRSFPSDFYYAGYAHQGAFWLTIALGLATAVLSVVFRGETLADPRLGQLKRLALVWSGLNLLLSLAVFNRLFIYIDFNGMTRMRVIGLLGITSVLCGFVLVVVKILKNRDFVWLLHRQLWVPVLAVISFASLPVDWLINKYNVTRAKTDNPAAVVQIVAQRTSVEGVLPVVELMDAEDPTVRNGARALLALWAAELEMIDVSGRPNSELARAKWVSDLGHSTPWIDLEHGFSRRGRRSVQNWLSFQWADSLLKQRLESQREKWEEFAHSQQLRNSAIDDFFQYAYQWY